MKNIDAILFDIGNVLVPFDFSRALERVGALGQVPADALRPLLMPKILAMECGALDPVDFVRDAMDLTGFSGTAEEFTDAYCDIFFDHEPMAEFVARAAEKVPLYLLSNTSEIHLAFLRGRFPLFRHFSGGAYSFESGCLKPEEKIYRDAIERCGLRPGRTVYVDDLVANVEMGEALGFRAFCYNWRDHAAFETWIGNGGE